MRASEDRNIEYQDRTGGLCLTANIYPKICRIEKKASDKNLVIIILDGDGIVSIPGCDRWRAGKGKLVFIPANTAWEVEILNPGQTLEIQFADLNNFYCELYFRSLLHLCNDITHTLQPLYSCPAIDEYVERVVEMLYRKRTRELSNDYELFTIFGVYYPRSVITNFLYPFLKTLEL